MEYLLTNLSENDIQKLSESNIEWYPDDIMDDSPEYTICFDTEKERMKAMEFLGIKNYRERRF